MVSDLWQVSGFLRVLWFPHTNKTDWHDIAEKLLKVALNTITPPPPPLKQLFKTQGLQHVSIKIGIQYHKGEIKCIHKSAWNTYAIFLLLACYQLVIL